MTNPWDVIRPPSNDVNARRVDHTHSLDLFWARDHLGRYLFIYEFSSDEKIQNVKLPDLAGIKAIITTQDRSNKSRLILVLKERADWEIFLSLCNDIVQSTRNSKSTSTAIQAMLRRLRRWHEFLKFCRKEILSEEKIKGLIGELLFIKNHLLHVFGAGQAIKYWQGPEGLPQDFNVNNSAIEVKCQSGATVPSIKITSADQLCPQLPEMYIYVVTLGKTAPESENAINLPLLIEEINKSLFLGESVHLERFNDLLYSTGYIDSDLYLDFSYVFVGEQVFQVTDKFPKICQDKISSGIINLTYSINLSACEPFERKPDWMEAKK